MKAVLFHPDAEEEMIASAVFYETRSNGLGHKFLNEIARLLDLISSSPKTWPVFSDDSLKEAEVLLKEGMSLRSVMNRLYYAMFYPNTEIEIRDPLSICHCEHPKGAWQSQR